VNIAIVKKQHSTLRHVLHTDQLAQIQAAFLRWRQMTKTAATIPTTTGTKQLDFHRVEACWATWRQQVKVMRYMTRQRHRMVQECWRSWKVFVGQQRMSLRPAAWPSEMVGIWVAGLFQLPMEVRTDLSLFQLVV
jgi:hypothetical protein